MIKNTTERYGLVSISLHWGVALCVLVLFALGLWMVDLSYYDVWYKKGPDLHRSIGVLLFIGMGFRFAWRCINPTPKPLNEGAKWSNLLAHIVHLSFYPLIFILMIAGYLITTASGDPVYVFNWFEVPATLTGGKDQAELAGDVHFVLALLLVALALVHAAAALFHHFIKRDRTLVRMLKP